MFRTVLRKLRFCHMVVKMDLLEAERPRLDSQERRLGSLRPRPPLNNTRWCHPSVALPNVIHLDVYKFLAYNEKTLYQVAMLYLQC